MLVYKDVESLYSWKGAVEVRYVDTQNANAGITYGSVLGTLAVFNLL